MIIYIASPYSSYADKQAAVDAQMAAFATLRDLGHETIAPLLSHYIDQRHPASYARWLQWCLAMVAVSDVVLRLPGDSDGADREVAEARRLGKPVVYGIDGFVSPGTYYEVTGIDSFISPGTYYEVTGDDPWGDPPRSADELGRYELIVDSIRALGAEKVTT